MDPKVIANRQAAALRRMRNALHNLPAELTDELNSRLSLPPANSDPAVRELLRDEALASLLEALARNQRAERKTK